MRKQHVAVLVGIPEPDNLATKSLAETKAWHVEFLRWSPTSGKCGLAPFARGES